MPNVRLFGLNKLISFLAGSAPDLGLLAIRVPFGVAMLAYGLGKLVNFNEYRQTFPDPLDIGRDLSLGLVTIAQVPCAVLVLLGCYTRWFAVPPLVAMLIAAFVHHSSPWSDGEVATLYAMAFLAVFAGGGGRYSIDFLLQRKKKAAGTPLV